MTMSVLEANLRAHSVPFCRSDQQMWTTVRRKFTRYDIQCSPFDDTSMTGTVLMPLQKEPDIVSINLLCTELKERYPMVEFVYFPDQRMLRISGLIFFCDSTNAALQSFALLCEHISPLLQLLEEGKTTPSSSVGLALWIPPPRYC